jgi:hypothetical protein
VNISDNTLLKKEYEGKNTRLSTLAAKRSIIPDKAMECEKQSLTFTGMIPLIDKGTFHLNQGDSHAFQNQGQYLHGGKNRLGIAAFPRGRIFHPPGVHL